jgi:hypothetical protein
MAPTINYHFDAFRQIDNPPEARIPAPPLLPPGFGIPRFILLPDRDGQLTWLGRASWEAPQRHPGPGFQPEEAQLTRSISRSSARFSLERFHDVFARRVVSITIPLALVAVAVGGKTRKQGHDADPTGRAQGD